MLKLNLYKNGDDTIKKCYLNTSHVKVKQAQYELEKAKVEKFKYISC